MDSLTSKREKRPELQKRCEGLKKIESIPIPVEHVSHPLRASRENPARAGLMIALRKSEFDRFRSIFMTSTLVVRTKGFVRG